MVNLAEQYLDYRRKLGFKLRSEGWALLSFARYADQTGHRGAVTTELAVRWAKLPQATSPLYWARRLDIVRRFAKHRAPFETCTEIPPDGILGPSYRRSQPYIYSEDEIAALLRVAGQLRPVGGLRAYTYVTLFGLLACSGLRISEALRLSDSDVDLKRGVLTINDTKFHKSRLVPLSQSTTDALVGYAERRDQCHLLGRSTAFFVKDAGTPLKGWNVREAFSTLRRWLGWARHGKAAPRIQDIRHTFVVRRLLRWYEEGADIDQKIAALSTYLGHVKVSYTYWYLTAVPELMAVTSMRFERFVRGGKEVTDV
jgi:integrase